MTTNGDTMAAAMEAQESADVKPRTLTDIGLVAFLYATGERPLRIVRSSPARHAFIFCVSEDRMLDYWQGRTRVEPRLLFQAMRDIKALMAQAD